MAQENQELKKTRELKKSGDKFILCIGTEKEYTKKELKDIHAEIKTEIENHRSAKAQTDKQLKSLDFSKEEEKELLELLDKIEKATRIKKKKDLQAQSEHNHKALKELEDQLKEIEQAIPELKRN